MYKPPPPPPPPKKKKKEIINFQTRQENLRTSKYLELNFSLVIITKSPQIWLCFRRCHVLLDLKTQLVQSTKKQKQLKKWQTVEIKLLVCPEVNV